MNIQSMWLLPLMDEYQGIFNEIKKDVAENGGEAFILKSAMECEGERLIIEKFNAARNEEYTELMEQCQEYFKEIIKETAVKNFSFAEIEENEEELNKLKGWYEKILSRDFFDAPLKEESIQMISKCENMLEEFCNNVYEFNDDIRS